uniref:SHSP domain-containing protein n=1 Tax=Angiostrongylus cantonensis TaxID=6313 RepID=A0A158PAU2_ANGCA
MTTNAFLRPALLIGPLLHSTGKLKSLLAASRVVDDEKKFAVSIDVSHFKPEELKVSLDGKVLTVEGKQECKNDNSYMNYGFRSFVRSWTLPNDVDTNAIQTELNDQGKLTIEAPKNGATVSKKDIPIMPPKDRKR